MNYAKESKDREQLAQNLKEFTKGKSVYRVAKECGLTDMVIHRALKAEPIREKSFKIIEDYLNA